MTAMNGESQPRLPALLSPAIQTATRILTLGAILLISLLAVWFGGATESPDRDQSDPTRQVFLIDINQADHRALTLMPGIGSLTAEGFLEDRNRNGPFRSVTDLGRVPGIGPKTIQEISPYCQAVSPD